MDSTDTTTRTATNRTKKFWIGGIAAAVALVLASVGITLAVTDGFDDMGDDDATSQDVRTDSDDTASDDATTTTSTDSDDVAIDDADREKAEKAALAVPEAKGGTVTDVERSNDADHAYEVDIALEDGTDVDVELDKSFSVTRVDAN